jgi:hypothetical protein
MTETELTDTPAATETATPKNKGGRPRKLPTGPRPAPGTLASVQYAQARLDAELDKGKVDRWKVKGLTASLEGATRLYEIARSLPPVQTGFEKLGGDYQELADAAKVVPPAPVLLESPEQLPAERFRESLGEQVRRRDEEREKVRVAERAARVTEVNAAIERFEKKYLNYDPRIGPADLGQPGSAINNEYLLQAATYKRLLAEREIFGR